MNALRVRSSGKVSAFHPLLVFGSLFAVALALSLFAVAGPPSAGASIPTIVYLEPADTPNAARLGISSKVLDQNGIAVVHTVDELQTSVEARKPKAIWINRHALALVSAEWLRVQVASGTAIAGINVTKQDLGAVLAVDGGGAADWNPGRPFFSIYYEATVHFTNANGQPAAANPRGWFNHTYDPQDPRDLLGFTQAAIEAMAASGVR